MEKSTSDSTEEEPIIGGKGIPVGPNPEPEPPEATTLIVEFKLSDETFIQHKFFIPAGQTALGMMVSLMKGSKNLGPILGMPFSIHADSKQLHTICRRELDDPTIETVEF